MLKPLVKAESKKYSQLPTQTAHYIRALNGNIIELAATGSIGGDDGGPTLAERSEALEDHAAGVDSELETIGSTLSSQSAAMAEMDTKITALQDAMAESPVEGKTMGEWAEETNSSLADMAGNISDITSAMGEKGGQFGAGDTVWSVLGDNATAIETLETSMATMQQSINNLSAAGATNTAAIASLNAALNTSPTNGETLHEWAQSTQDTLDAQATTNANTATLLNDLTVTW